MIRWILISIRQNNTRILDQIAFFSIDFQNLDIFLVAYAFKVGREHSISFCGIFCFLDQPLSIKLYFLHHIKFLSKDIFFHLVNIKDLKVKMVDRSVGSHRIISHKIFLSIQTSMHKSQHILNDSLIRYKLWSQIVDKWQVKRLS